MRWQEFLESHAMKVYSSVTHGELKAAHRLAKKIKTKSVKDRDTVRSVYRKGWSGLESKNQVEKALSVLEELSRLRIDQVKSGYRNREEIRLNPKLTF